MTKNLKIKIEVLNIMKVVDVSAKSVHHDTIEFLEENYVTYKDITDLDEHLVNINDVEGDYNNVIPSDYPNRKRIIADMKALSIIANENDSSYIRFIH
jgi:hypothetical protein